MRLAEIFVAAEHALRNTISDPVLWKSLSSVEEFEVIAFKPLHSGKVYILLLPESSCFIIYIVTSMSTVHFKSSVGD